MPNDRFLQNRARARASLERGNSLTRSDVVQRALGMARSRMDTIVEEARKYRTETEEKINTISDQELRDSVEAFAKPRPTRQG